MRDRPLYARQRLLNGYTNVFAFLGQYFDKAYTVDTNGVVTTNEAGIISPYGEFFPTKPGRAAIVTMPDIDTGERGTGVVQVIKLQLDVNHDSVMDPSFDGPDNTSEARPFVFWVNNDNDGDGVGKDIENFKLLDSSYFKLRSQRGMEDFARLWVMDMPALSYFSDNYVVNLSWRNVSTGSPAIKIFRAAESDGGIGYLTSTNIVQSQLTNSLYNTALGNVANGIPFYFPINEFASPTNRHYLFEGTGVGRGELVLTISQNGIPVAQTSAWLDLRNVRDLYERAMITNRFNGVISNWSSGLKYVENPQHAESGEDQNTIVFVHGINVSDFEWLMEGDTFYKRFYWSGFHGKFATVKWPCEFFNLWTLFSLDLQVFNRSEIKADKAGSALKAYLDNVHDRFPGYSVHLMVHSQGNSVVSEAIEQGATFDSYILTQGAVPASCYDVNAPFHTGLSNAEAIWGPTPEWRVMGYRGVYTNMTGRIVNFYNPKDPVLSIWISDQGSAKPNQPALDYRYNGNIATYDPPFGSSYTVTDPQESRAFVSRSRTLTIGQSGPESPHGVIQSGVNLNTQFGFSDSFPDDHSAQWAWPIQTTRPYFQEFLRKCHLEPAP